MEEHDYLSRPFITKDWNDTVNIDIHHKINGVWYHICQIIDTEGNIKYFTNGQQEN